MVRLCIVFLMLFLNFSVVNAQNSVVLKVDLGASTLTGEVLGTYKMRFSTGSGLGYNLQLSDHFAIEPAAKYTTKGTSINGTNADINYFSAPLTLKYYPVKCFYLHAGPEASYLVSAKYPNYRGEMPSFKDEIRKTDVGLNFGADFFAGNSSLTIGFNGVIGFDDISSKYLFESRNKTWMASLNYFLSKK